jgi:L-fuculose-phosphate aldolase
MDSNRELLICAIVEICHQLAVKGWVANHDGNVSLRFGDTLLATPTAVSKADVTADMIITLDMEGKKLQGKGNPFSEIKLHLAAYQARPDIQAVVHAHPPLATARGLVGGDFGVQLPEAVISIGDSVPVIPYAFPGAPENEASVAEALSRSDLLMLAGNGVLAGGRDVKEAFLRIELLEHLLRIDHYAKAMGPMLNLPAADKDKLLEKRASLGLGPKKAATAIPQSDKGGPQVPSQANKLIKNLIFEELKKILAEKE